MPRKGFTILELLLVISVIVTLMGLSYPIISHMRMLANKKSTRMLVQSVHTAVEQYSLHMITGKDGHGYLAWTLGWDGTTNALDGNPSLYALTDLIQTRAPATYSGFVTMTGFPIESKRLDSKGRVTDLWHNPLQISWAVHIYGVSGFGIWSMGPDKLTGTPDDIRSWDNDTE